LPGKQEVDRLLRKLDRLMLERWLVTLFRTEIRVIGGSSLKNTDAG